MESQEQVLFRMMEEEISHYEELVKKLQKEADYLRQGSPEDLLGEVKAVAQHVEAIQQIHQSIRKTIAEVLNTTGQEKTLVELMALLPPGDSQKLRKYQGTLDKLKEWVMQINSRNKAFIQDSLAYGRDLFSLLTPSTAASPVYVQNGKRRPSAQQPLSVDRKV
jgi:flagellar biosynthesis/type III secretory pathway chaperone